MLRDHPNKWKQKHTSFWWKPLCTSHSFFFWKRTFPEWLGGLCHTWGNSWGVGGLGHQFPAKMENPGRWGGPKWNSLRGGGLDIFWNYTMLDALLTSWIETYNVTLVHWFKKAHFSQKLLFRTKFDLYNWNLWIILIYKDTSSAQIYYG